MHEHQQQLRDTPQEALRQALQERVPVANDPHIWVGRIADVVAGRPVGSWIEAAQPVARIARDIRVRVSPEDQPWSVYGHRGFGRYPPDGRISLAEIRRRANLAAEDIRAFNAWAQLQHNDREELGRFYDRYLGRYDRLRDWANLEVERAGWDRWLDDVLPAAIRLHVELNVDSLAHELVRSGEIVSLPDPVPSGVFVFRTNEESLSCP